MKVFQTSEAVQTNDLLGQQSFSIRHSAQAFKVLSDGLYSDKVTAVVRELGCNAYDAHVAAGNADIPFYIQLPSTLEPEFKIRDYGTGLEHKDVLTLYTTYFDSTKNNSNDFIGALGLGSKSPFSLVEQFVVRSFFNGEVRTYTAFLNQGFPQIAHMATAQTDEPNGLEITIPVEDNLHQVFHSRVRSVFERFPVKPKLNSPDFTFANYEVYKEGSNWKFYSSHHTGVNAVQGNVAYPIDLGAIPELTRQQKLFLEECSSLDLIFDIGELDVSASREKLSYDSRTCENLLKGIDTYIKEFTDHISELFDECKTLWEAKTLFNKMFKTFYRSNGSDGGIPRFVANYCSELARHGQLEVKWKGVTIKDGDIVVNLADIDGTIFYKYSSSYVKNQGRHEAPSWVKVPADERTLVVIDDLKTGGVSRLVQYNKDNGSIDTYTYHASYDWIYSFKPPTDKVKRYLEKLFDGATIKYTSDMPSSTTKMKRLNLATYVIKDSAVDYIIDSVHKGYFYDKSNIWIKRSVDVDKGGLYLSVNRGEPEYQGSAYNFYYLYAVAKEQGFIQPDTNVVGVIPSKKKVFDDLDNWQSFRDFFRQKATEFITSRLTEEEVIEYLSFIKVRANARDRDTKIRFWTEVGEAVPNSDFSKFKDYVERINAIHAKIGEIDDTYFNIIAFYAGYTNDKANYDSWDKMLIDLVKKYPLMGMVLRYSNYSGYSTMNRSIEEDIADVIDYAKGLRCLKGKGY